MFTTKFHVTLWPPQIDFTQYGQKKSLMILRISDFFVGINLHVLDCVPDT